MLRKLKLTRNWGISFSFVIVIVLAIPWLVMTRNINMAIVNTSSQSPTVAQPDPPLPAVPLLEFTMFRGNPARNLSAIGTIPRRPKLVWRMATRTKLEGQYEQRGSKKLTAKSPWSGLGWTGQPIRRGDLLYFGSSDSYVYCLNALTGDIQWYYPTHHCVKGSISLFGDYLYHGGRDNKLHCYNLQGEMMWETRIGNDMDSNPVVVDDRGYVGGEDKSVYCFDPETGKMLWRMGPTEGSVESSPCVADGRVFAGSGRGILYCLQADTGKQLWRFKTCGDTDSTPVYYNGRIYVGCATGDEGETGHLWCVDAANGKPIWHVPFARGIWATVAINPACGRLDVGCNNGYFYSLRMADGALIWKRKLGNRIWGSAAVTDGCIIVGVRDGRVWCLEEETGTPIWVFDDGYDLDATPLVAGGMIVIGSQNGWVYAIGEAAEDEPINPHWFMTEFPTRRRPDHDSQSIRTIANPAPIPQTYTDTSAATRANLLKPIYGPAHAHSSSTISPASLTVHPRMSTDPGEQPGR